MDPSTLLEFDLGNALQRPDYEDQLYRWLPHYRTIRPRLVDAQGRQYDHLLQPPTDDYDDMALTEDTVIRCNESNACHRPFRSNTAPGADRCAGPYRQPEPRPIYGSGARLRAPACGSKRGRAAGTL